MPDREKVIGGLQRCSKHDGSECQKCPYFSGECTDDLMADALELLNEQEDLGTELANAVELIHKKNKRIEKLLKEQEAVVRCKDCIHRGKAEKCVLAAISEEKDYPLFMLDNRGEWFCADGERKEGR